MDIIVCMVISVILNGNCSCFQIRYIVQTQGNVGLFELLIVGTKGLRFFKKTNFNKSTMMWEYKLKVTKQTVKELHLVMDL